MPLEQMTIKKFFLKSKTIIGIVIILLSTFGVNIPVSNDEVANVLDLSQQLIGAVLVIYGRFTATKPLGFKK